jgi:hypothetical protein
MSEATFKFGMYQGYSLDVVPKDYLFWIFPRLKKIHSFKQGDPGNYNHGNSKVLYGQILEYFLSQDIRMEDKSKEGKGYCFYFNGFKKVSPDGDEISFLQCMWRGKNSEHKHVYDTESQGFTWFIEEDGGKFHLSTKYVAHRWYFGGQTMIYEKNPNYYFYDGYRRLMEGAYLLRRPTVPNTVIQRNFSKNFKINE